MQAWSEISKALAASPEPADCKLSKSIVDFVMQTEVARAVQRHRAAQRQAELSGMAMTQEQGTQRVRPEPNRGPDMSRWWRRAKAEVLAAGRARWGRSPKQPSAREPQRAGAPRRVKGSLAPNCARP